MAYGFDASSILSSYMEGANFVARGMERAEERAKAERAEKIRGFVGQYMAATSPQFDDKGQLVAQSMTNIMNSQGFKDMANDPLLQPYLNQGITDSSVKQTRYVGAVPDPSEPDNGGKAVPMLQHIGADKKPLAPPGPLTSDRSRDGNASVVPLNSNNIAGVLVQAAYAVDPTLGHEILNRMHSQSVQGFRTLYRNAKTDAEKEGLLTSAGRSGIDPELIYGHSGADVTVEHPTGLIETKKPGGSTTITYDPELYKRTGGAGLSQSENAKFDIEKGQFPERLGMKSKEQIASSEIANDQANKHIGDLNARSNSAAVAQHQTKLNLTGQDNAAVQNAVAGLDSQDPTVQAASKQSLLNYFQTPEDARTYVRATQAEDALSGDLRSAIKGSSTDAYRAIAKSFPYASKDTQSRVYTQLEELAQSSDPAVREAARGGLSAAVTVLKGPQTAKAPEPGKYQSTMAKDYYKSVSGNKNNDRDVQAMEAGAQQAFNRLRADLPNEITAGSKGETYASVASAKAHYLAQDGMKNAEKPMYIHTELQDLGYPVDRLGSPKDFVTEIYNPLGDALKKAGVAEMDDSTVRRIGSELTVGLWQKGVDKGVAINEVTKLFKDPRTYANKLKAAGGDLRSLADGLAKEIEGRPSGLGQAMDKAGRVIDAASME